MARISEAVLKNGLGEGGVASRPILNPDFGGLQGWSPRLGYLGDGAEWLSSQASVSQQVIPFLLEAPKGFKYFDNSNYFYRALKKLWELDMKTISGLNRTIEVEYGTHQIGFTQEVFEEELRVNRAKSELSTTWTEPRGNIYESLIEIWIRYLIGDDVSQSPLIYRINDELAKAKDLALSDINSATVLFVEPDESFRWAKRAYLSFNIKPKKTPDMTSRKDISSSGEIQESSVDWTSITLSNDATFDLANLFLKESIFSKDSIKAPLPVDTSNGLSSALSAELASIKEAYLDETNK